MIQLLVNVLLVALLAAFVFCFMYKTKTIEWVQVHGNDFFAKLFNCQFCLSFWINGILSLTAFLILWDWSFLIIPFFSTVITRKLISN